MYLLNKELQVVFIFQNVMLSKVQQIVSTANKDLFYVSGYNTQNPPIAVIYIFIIGKSDPIYQPCFSNSPYLGDAFDQVNQNGDVYQYYENIIQSNYLTVYTQKAINLNKMSILSTRVQFIVGDNETIRYKFERGSIQNSIQYSGTESGALVSKSQSITNYDTINIQKSFKNSTDVIVELKYSTYIGVYLIRTDKQVSIYDLYTNQFLEILKLSDQIQPFIQCDFIEKAYSIICFNNQQILLRKFFLQDERIEFQSNFNINGYTYDTQNSLIYIYGDKILQLNSKLQQLTIILNQYDITKIQNCQLTQNLLICINSQKYLILINKLNFYQQQAIQIIGFLNNIYLLVDEQYERIILLNEVCLIYNFKGEILNNLGNIVGVIAQYGIHDQYYIIFSNQQGRIINRDTLEWTQIASPASLQIVKYAYINLNQQIAYFCSASEFGQIYIYDIQSYQTNKVSGESGNVYRILDNIVITEIVDQNQKLLGLAYDNQSSYVFVYTQTNVYLINVSNLGYKFQNQLNQQNNYFTEVKLSNDASIYSQFLIIGDQNIIYRYQEQYLTSEMFFLNEQQLKDIRFDISNDVLVVAFVNKVFLYQNYEQNNRNNNLTKYIQLDIKFQRFLANSIFQTYDKKIIHVNIKSGQIINIIKIQLDQYINSFLYDEQNNILFIGLNDLSVLLYFVDTKENQRYTFQQANKMFTSVKFIGIISSEECYFATLGGQFLVINHKTNEITNQLNLNKQLKMEDDLNLINIQYDNSYHRIVFNFIGDFKVFIWDLYNQKLEQIIGIPNTHSNSIMISSQFIVTISSSKLNFYSRTRPCLFQTSIQKYIIANQIIQWYIIKETYIILLFEQKFEVFVIDGQNNFMVDQQNYEYPKLMKSYQIGQFIYFYGLHQKGAFLFSYNTNLYQYKVLSYQQSSLQAENTAFQCYISTQSNKNYQSLNQINSMSPITQQVVGFNGRTIQNKINTQTYVFLSILGTQLLNLSSRISQLTQISNLLFLPYDQNFNNLTFEENQLTIYQNINPQSIIELTDITQQQAYSYEKNIIMQFLGCNNFLLKNSSFKKNIGGAIIKVSNQVQQNNNIITLQDDIFTINNLQVHKNNSTQMTQIILIQSSNVFIQDIDFSQNVGNCLAYGSQKCEISNSIFYQNSAIDGGAIYFYSIQNYIQIQNSTFKQNKAQGSGGSLLFENLNQNCLIFFDDITKIIENQAKIGGGLRILNSQLDYQLPKGFPFQQNVFNNKAEIYGDDSTYHIQSIVINKYKSLSASDQNKNYTLLFEKKETILLNSHYSGIIQIENFMSGGKIQLQIDFLDNYQRKINFQPSILRQNKYPIRIQKELTELQINIESISSTNTQLIGDKQVNYLLYDQETSSFILTDLTISASIESQFYFKISTSLENIYQNFYPYLMVINFRTCAQGEITQSITNSIKVCQYCTLGTCSFEKPQQIPSYFLNQTQNNTTQQYLSNQCKLCPSSALYCEGSLIKLKNGFWRQNQTTDEIIQCNQIMNFCQPEESSSSIEGCAEGYIGALCSECDLQGKVWNKTDHMYAPSLLKGVCSECSNIIFSYLFLAFNVLCLLLYFLISEKTFFVNCQYSQMCFYLRKLNILPILKNSIQDASGFYMKILITYLQFSSILIQQQNSFSLKISLPITLVGSSSYYLTGAYPIFIQIRAFYAQTMKLEYI
ncbi:hypothetical protein ABPG72_016154 [Tetrahymena utriculariae]